MRNGQQPRSEAEENEFLTQNEQRMLQMEKGKIVVTVMRIYCQLPVILYHPSMISQLPYI